jgi:uroporphyrinogen decarboxylase
MRQAGRYLPEYREIRERVDFLTLCKTPELATEVTLQPVRRFGVDAAILFSDILIPVEAMGARVAFEERRGPVLASPVRTQSDVDALVVRDPQEACPYTLETIRLLRRELDGTPLVGFAGAPFTLASYLIEGGGSRHYLEVKRMMYQGGDMFRGLMSKLADQVGRYLAAQAEAGAQALQLFDTWAGVLSPADYRAHVLPWTRAVLEHVRRATGGRVPLIHYARGTAGILDALMELDVDVHGIDWTVDIGQVRRALGPRRGVQGNLDPVLLHAPAATIDAAVAGILSAAGTAPGHVFNLGHGILPTTPIEGLQALVEAVHRHGTRGAAAAA